MTVIFVDFFYPPRHLSNVNYEKHKNINSGYMISIYLVREYDECV